MAAANTDKLRKKKSLFQTTLNGAISDSDTTLTLNSAAGLPTDTAVTIVINRVDANNNATPSAMEVLTGTVSGSTITNLLRAKDSTTAKSHANASVVEMVWDAATWNDFVDAYLTEHNQDGTHKAPSTAKTSLVDADLFGMFDSAASNLFKKITWANIKADIWTIWGALIGAGTDKATPADNDAIALMDSAATNATKKLTWANLKAILKTYFDTLYTKCTGADINTGTDDGKFATSKAIKDANILTQAWTPWTPTWTGLTIGNAVVNGAYTRIGKTVIARLDVVFGTGTSITGDPNFTLPVTSITYSLGSGFQILGDVAIGDTGTGNFFAYCMWTNTTTARLRLIKTDGTYASYDAVSSTVPMTWTTGDGFSLYIVYEAA